MSFNPNVPVTSCRHVIKKDGKRVTLSPGDALIFEKYADVGIQMRAACPNQDSPLLFLDEEGRDAIGVVMHWQHHIISVAEFKEKSRLFASVIIAMTGLRSQLMPESDDSRQVYTCEV